VFRVIHNKGTLFPYRALNDLVFIKDTKSVLYELLVEVEAYKMSVFRELKFRNMVMQHTLKCYI
jgi:hypothetical protein